jgi:Rod binding domain-containing protein
MAETSFTHLEGAERVARREKVAVQELERFFVTAFLKELRESVEDSELFPKDPGRRMQMDMMDELISAEAAKSGQFGIGKMISHQLHARDRVRGLESIEAEALDSEVKQFAVSADKWDMNRAMGGLGAGATAMDKALDING